MRRPKGYNPGHDDTPAHQRSLRPPARAGRPLLPRASRRGHRPGGGDDVARPPGPRPRRASTPLDRQVTVGGVGDVAAQADAIMKIAAWSMGKAGGRLADVVRNRMY